MRIGRLAELTGTSRRLLRYYEEQGLIGAARSENGYRDYADSTVDKVHQVRGLIDAGLPTRVIRDVLPCLDTPRTLGIAHATPETIGLLEDELTRMRERIACLERNRDAIARYLDDVRAGAVRVR